MQIRKWNEIFGYGLFSIGALKIILIIITIAQFGTNLTSAFNGEVVDTYSSSNFSTIIGLAQIVFAIGSIIMIIINIKNQQPEVIGGYLWGLGAILLELVVPSFLFIYFVFAECSIYMKAGLKIRNNNTGQGLGLGLFNNKQLAKDTEWFYGSDDKRAENSNKVENLNIDKNENANENQKKEDDFLDYIKVNKFIVVLISIILVVVLVAGLIIYNIVNRNNDEIPEVNLSKNTVVEKEDEEIIYKTEQNQDRLEKRKILDKIAKIFNNCKQTKKMEEKGYIMNAIADDYKISTYLSIAGVSFDVYFTLEDNILSTRIIYISESPEITALKLSLAITLVDCVGQANGYEDGKLFNALGDEKAMNYSIEKEGVEIKQLEKNKDFIIKVDLNSNFSFLNT